MAESLREFWGRVREFESQLEQFPLMVSLQSPTHGTTGGCFVEMDRHGAGIALTKGTHRLATKTEAEEYRASQSKAARDITIADLKGSKKTVMVTAAELGIEPESPAKPKK